MVGSAAPECRRLIELAGVRMPRRPNYRFERAERDRVKKSRKEEKLKRQQDRTAPPEEGDPPAADEPAPPAEA